jgi:hypothetical protein
MANGGVINGSCEFKMTKSLQRAINRETPRTLLQAGRYTWGIARELIRQRANPDNSSAPGSPPHSHKSAFSAGFKKTIAYALTADKKAVVIGPKLVRDGLSELARVHEFGGTREVRDIDPELWNGVAIGQTAPVTYRYVSSKDKVIRSDSRPDPATFRAVKWIKIRTKGQAKHATRLYRRLVRKYPQKKIARYPARPYMRPALKFATPKLSAFWANSVK